MPAGGVKASRTSLRSYAPAPKGCMGIAVILVVTLGTITARVFCAGRGQVHAVAEIITHYIDELGRFWRRAVYPFVTPIVQADYKRRVYPIASGVLVSCYEKRYLLTAHHVTAPHVHRDDDADGAIYTYAPEHEGRPTTAPLQTQDFCLSERQQR